MSANGSSIYEALDFSSRVYQECNALAEVLRQGFSELLCEQEIKKRYKIAEKKHQRGMRWQEDSQSQGCLYHSLAYALALNHGKKKTPDSHLFFQISLAGDGMETGGNKEPLLHIGLWACEISFAGGSYMGFPLAVSHNIENSVLIRWDREWLYTLRLCSINNSADIETKIITPIRQLLCDAKADQALLEGLEGLAHYTQPEGATGQYHLSFQQPTPGEN